MYMCELENHLKWVIKDLKSIKINENLFKTLKINIKLEGIK